MHIIEKMNIPANYEELERQKLKEMVLILQDSNARDCSRLREIRGEIGEFKNIIEKTHESIKYFRNIVERDSSQLERLECLFVGYEFLLAHLERIRIELVYEFLLAHLERRRIELVDEYLEI